MSIQKLVALLQGEPIHNTFYHFTDIKNIDSIKRSGLLSWRELRRRGIKVPAPGGNQWSHDADAIVGMDDYVHLCMTKRHPMEYRARQEGRIGDCRYLRIHPKVVLIRDAKVCLEVANKRGAVHYPVDEGLGLMDLEVIYTRTDWTHPQIQERLRAAEKYEVLIPKMVAADLILDP